MKFNLTEISESEFKLSRASLLFTDDVANHRFALLGNEFKLAWHSDSIDPVVTEVKPGVFGVGIDLNFAVLKNESVLLNIPLESYFLSVEKLKDRLFVATQLEVIELNSDYSVKRSYALPDFFEKIAEDDQGIVIHCMNREKVKIGE